METKSQGIELSVFCNKSLILSYPLSHCIGPKVRQMVITSTVPAAFSPRYPGCRPGGPLRFREEYPGQPAQAAFARICFPPPGGLRRLGGSRGRGGERLPGRVAPRALFAAVRSDGHGRPVVKSRYIHPYPPLPWQQSRRQKYL